MAYFVFILLLWNDCSDIYFRICFHNVFLLFSLGRIPSCFNLSFGIQAMSTTQGSIAATKGIPKFEHEPEHLLVLVHGIMSR